MTPIEQKIIEIRDKYYPTNENETKSETISRISFIQGMKALAKELTQVPSEDEIIKEAHKQRIGSSFSNTFIEGARFASTFKVNEI